MGGHEIAAMECEQRIGPAIERGLRYAQGWAILKTTAPSYTQLDLE